MAIVIQRSHRGECKKFLKRIKNIQMKQKFRKNWSIFQEIKDVKSQNRKTL